ncbi:MAG TPA: threonine--tRNA ligase [Candidatus Margulisiibacteriota bacterium]|nr:threonine--tRNA ligase [Candidatus Margulisiibacteriota bacterium]
MATVAVTTPDGAVHHVEAGTRALDVLKTAGVLNNQVLAAQVNDRVVDLGRPLTEDCRIAPVAADSPLGLEVIRHSTAHLMAQAVKRLFPEVQVTIGPVIENGFYYDFKKAEPFTPEDLERIEATMREITKADFKVAREELPRDQAIELFRQMGENYKVEIIAGIPEERVSLYRQGEFVDLCRGPHVPSTGRIKAFKLTSIAGAYWRGDARNEMLQRIYGTAWANAKDLEAYLKRIEEAKQRDHRRLGQQLDLFSLHPISPGSPFFHPKGAVIYNTLVQFVRSLYGRYGYTEVITPLIYKTELWKTSGHYDAFRDDMFLMALDEDEYGVKPMNCPGHCYLFATRKYSYRDLPVRFADFSRLHRFEPSGTLAGLTRVRSMAQDDAHIYCTPEQLDSELLKFVEMTREVYGVFGFERVEVTLQTRPEKFLGRIELWEAAEAALRRVLEQAGYAVSVLPGEGAFYGPKIGFDFRDVLERSWTLATVQIDCAMPERFGLKYVTADSSLATPVMLHRAVLGSLERFIAILLEHTAGNFPLWLAPVQARVLTLTERQEAYGRQVTERLIHAGLRTELDDRNEKLGFKIREAQLQKVPYILVVGDKEAENGTIAPRHRGETLPAVRIDALIAQLTAEAVPGSAA